MHDETPCTLLAEKNLRNLRRFKPAEGAKAAKPLGKKTRLTGKIAPRSTKSCVALTAIALCAFFGQPIGGNLAYAVDIDADGHGQLLTLSDIVDDPLAAHASAIKSIRYTTRDEHNNLAQANGEIYLPQGMPPDGGWPVVAWGYGTAGVGPQCSTTYRFENGLEASLAVSLSYPAMQAFLDRGYAVVATDYIGLGSAGGKHHYLAALGEAHALTDALIAARSAFDSIGSQWVSAGHSQGGQAALMANNIADQYAPQLNLRGTVAFAPETNAENLLTFLGPGFPNPGGVLSGVTPLLLYIFYGLEQSRPDIDPLSYLNDKGRALVGTLESDCVIELQGRVKTIAPGDILGKWLSDPKFASVLHNYMGIPNSGFHHPILLLQGNADEIVPPYLTYIFDAELHLGAESVKISGYNGVGHYQIIDQALPEALDRIGKYFQ